ncbi:MAG: hypothetical protein JW958_09025 [Candidatus Eisenbacteria bacterium]|nr:hypothetical protein [Candidatus Eisenbacteria bacterium]
MNEHSGNVSIANPGQTYVPSGRSSPSTRRTYALLALIIAVLIQVPLGLSHAVAGFCLRFASGVYVVVAPLLFGGIAFLITGGILAYLLSVATKRAHCRNPRVERAVLAATIALSLVFRILVTSVSLRFLDMPRAAGALGILDLPAVYWVETLLGIGIVSFAAFAFLPKMRPYCEACARYMVKQQHLFAQSELNRVLSELSQGTLQAHEWTATKKLYPSTELELHVCDHCHSGFMKVDSNTVAMDGSKEKRSSVTVYSDRCQAGAMESVLNALREKPRTGA